jgi:hypothetical protein
MMETEDRPKRNLDLETREPLPTALAALLARRCSELCELLRAVDLSTQLGRHRLRVLTQHCLYSVVSVLLLMKSGQPS